MEHIVLFSGGASSAYVAKLVIKKYGKENTILLHTPTYAEHYTADLFREQVSNYLDVPITTQEDGRSLWDLIQHYKTIPSQYMPFCTQQLKIVQTDKFIRKFDNSEICLHYGYDTDEYRRIQKVFARMLIRGIKTEFDLYENRIKNISVKDIIQNEWKIELPQPYKYLKHNNCLPCFKAGKSQFKQFAKYYPNEFDRAIQAEIDCNYTVFKDCTLKDIRKEVEKNKNQITFLENDFNIPCECWS